MSNSAPTRVSEARKHITERCLVAADVDKTILSQAEGERAQFIQSVAHHLVDSAKMGMSLAFVTGNSMSQLADRFLRWLIEYLCHIDDLALLPQFHFFCNSGGVYCHVPASDSEFAKLLTENPAGQGGLTNKVLDLLTTKDNKGKITAVRPSLVDAGYLLRTQIPPADVEEIRQLLERSAETYQRWTKGKETALGRKYDLSKLVNNGQLVPPTVDVRPVEFTTPHGLSSATVQLTLKPILSFTHGITEDARMRLFERDFRTQLIEHIQRELGQAGLGRYIARPGGRSSIDVTLKKLDKAYAMEFLIDRLNLQGPDRRGFGANAIYLGDEVIVGGGNDYAVTKIPGLLVFAVNPDKACVPFLHRVFVPSSNLEGPEATAGVLEELNKAARNSLKAWTNGGRSEPVRYEHWSAISCFKAEMFGKRVQEKIEALRKSEKLTADEWEVLHAFVTLMHRDTSARKWLTILIDELDAIMTHMSESPRPTQPALGATSLEDSQGMGTKRKATSRI